MVEFRTSPNPDSLTGVEMRYTVGTAVDDVPAPFQLGDAPSFTSPCADNADHLHIIMVGVCTDSLYNADDDTYRCDVLLLAQDTISLN